MLILRGNHGQFRAGKSSGEPVWDADALDYIGRVQNADGQGLELSARIAIDNFVKGCKADGIWNAIKASCILAGARTLNGALVPLVGTAPTNFNFVSGDYNRRTGLVGNGTTKYLDANRTNVADPQDNNHSSVFVTFIGTGVLFGTSNGGSASATGSDVLLQNGSSRNRCSTGSTSGTPVASTLNGISRSAAALYTRRLAGANSSQVVASQTPSGGNFWIFARNSSTPSYSTSRIAFYSIGEALDLALLEAHVTTLINAYGVL